MCNDREMIKRLPDMPATNYMLNARDDNHREGLSFLAVYFHAFVKDFVIDSRPRGRSWNN